MKYLDTTFLFECGMETRLEWSSKMTEPRNHKHFKRLL